MAGFDFGKLFKGQMIHPNTSDRLAGIGAALGALDQGKVADLSRFRKDIRDRNASNELHNKISDTALLEQFTPEQRQMLATLPPQAAQQIIADTLFAGPANPVKGVEVGGNLVNPIDGSIIYEGQTKQGHRVLSAEEVASKGLPPGAYQQARDGKITSIGGGGQTINVQTGDSQGVIEIDNKTGRALISDPKSESGMRWVDITGGASSQEASKGIEQAQSLLDTIDAVIADPGLDSAVGTGGLVTKYLGPLAPDSTRARSRIEQLQGKAFLQAFESLKGGGQITEIEGRKAEQAIARLNTSQSPDDFRAALMELRGVIERAKGGGQAPTATMEMSDEDLLNMYLGGQ